MVRIYLIFFIFSIAIQLTTFWDPATHTIFAVVGFCPYARQIILVNTLIAYVSGQIGLQCTTC
jgi:predicted membrane protein